MILDVRKDIQCVRSAQSMLHAELKVRILPLVEGNNKECKINTLKYNYDKVLIAFV